MTIFMFSKIIHNLNSVRVQSEKNMKILKSDGPCTCICGHRTQTGDGTQDWTGGALHYQSKEKMLIAKMERGELDEKEAKELKPQKKKGEKEKESACDKLQKMNQKKQKQGTGPARSGLGGTAAQQKLGAGDTAAQQKLEWKQ